MPRVVSRHSLRKLTEEKDNDEKFKKLEVEKIKERVKIKPSRKKLI